MVAVVGEQQSPGVGRSAGGSTQEEYFCGETSAVQQVLETIPARFMRKGCDPRRDSMKARIDVLR